MVASGERFAGQHELDLIGGACEMKLAGLGHPQVAFGRCALFGRGVKDGLLHRFQALGPLFSDTAELRGQHVRRIRATPSPEVIIGNADHGCSVPRRAGEEQICRSAQMRTLV